MLGVLRSFVDDLHELFSIRRSKDQSLEDLATHATRQVVLEQRTSLQSTCRSEQRQPGEVAQLPQPFFKEPQPSPHEQSRRELQSSASLPGESTLQMASAAYHRSSPPTPVCKLDETQGRQPCTRLLTPQTGWRLARSVVFTGTFYNEVTDSTRPVEGTVDQKTQCCCMEAFRR